MANAFSFILIWFGGKEMMDTFLSLGRVRMEDIVRMFKFFLPIWKKKRRQRLVSNSFYIVIHCVHAGTHTHTSV